MPHTTPAGRMSEADVGYRAVLRVSLPLVISMGTVSAVQFTDRLMLSRYSVEAIAAVTPASGASFLVTAFFMGVVSYAGVFVAQYSGAGRPERVGAVVWQTIYFCIFAFLVQAALTPLGGALFRLVGHRPEIAALETTFFTIMMLGGVFIVAEAGLGGFFSGRGKTRVVMLVNLLGMSLNIPLDYLLIYGIGPFPELGIAGAALGSVAAYVTMTLAFLWLIFRKENEPRYKVRSAWRPDRDLFTRLLAFGLPGGIEFALDIGFFVFFIMMAGRLAMHDIAATNIAFAINTLSYLPMAGFSIGVSMLTGQAMGADKPRLARLASRHTLVLGFGYMVVLGCVFFFLPYPFIDIFRPPNLDAQGYELVRENTAILLKIIAVYGLFDVVSMVRFGTLKGAGDARYLMLAMGTCGILVLVTPLLVFDITSMGLFAAWLLLPLYVLALATVMELRYRTEAWTRIRMIGQTAKPARA